MSNRVIVTAKRRGVGSGKTASPDHPTVHTPAKAKGGKTTPESGDAPIVIAQPAAKKPAPSQQTTATSPAQAPAPATVVPPKAAAPVVVPSNAAVHAAAVAAVQKAAAAATAAARAPQTDGDSGEDEDSGDEAAPAHTSSNPAPKAGPRKPTGAAANTNPTAAATAKPAGNSGAATKSGAAAASNTAAATTTTRPPLNLPAARVTTGGGAPKSSGVSFSQIHGSGDPDDVDSGDDSDPNAIAGGRGGRAAGGGSGAGGGIGGGMGDLSDGDDGYDMVDDFGGRNPADYSDIDPDLGPRFQASAQQARGAGQGLVVSGVGLRPGGGSGVGSARAAGRGSGGLSQPEVGRQVSNDTLEAWRVAREGMSHTLVLASSGNSLYLSCLRAADAADEAAEAASRRAALASFNAEQPGFEADMQARLASIRRSAAASQAGTGSLTGGARAAVGGSGTAASTSGTANSGARRAVGLANAPPAKKRIADDFGANPFDPNLDMSSLGSALESGTGFTFSGFQPLDDGSDAGANPFGGTTVAAAKAAAAAVIPVVNGVVVLDEMKMFGQGANGFRMPPLPLSLRRPPTLIFHASFNHPLSTRPIVRQLIPAGIAQSASNPAVARVVVLYDLIFSYLKIDDLASMCVVSRHANQVSMQPHFYKVLFLRQYARVRKPGGDPKKPTFIKGQAGEDDLKKAALDPLHWRARMANKFDDGASAHIIVATGRTFCCEQRTLLTGKRVVVRVCADCEESTVCFECGKGCEGESCACMLCDKCARAINPAKQPACERCHRQLCDHDKSVGGEDAGGFVCNECECRICSDCCPVTHAEGGPICIHCDSRDSMGGIGSARRVVRNSGGGGGGAYDSNDDTEDGDGGNSRYDEFGNERGGGGDDGDENDFNPF